jgi:two-component system OmpR family response regulator
MRRSSTLFSGRMPLSHRRLQYIVPAVTSQRTTSKILIVDDDEGVTQTFARMLRLEGYQVRTAVSAEKGLIEAQQSHPDAIILDLRMPLVDGLGFLRRLRAHDDQRDTPVAIVTGDYFLDDSVSTELRELGAELRFKPLWLEDLVGLARNLLKVTH